MATLNDVRDRIRVQLEAASGLIRPLIVTSSDATLSSLRNRVKARLQDQAALSWDNTALDEAIRTALEQYSKYNQDKVLTTIDVTNTGREIDISHIDDIIRVERIWWDYDADEPGFPPNYRHFDVWPGSILYIDDRNEPQAGDTIRIWYTRNHTLDGLDGATDTSIPGDDEGTIVTGACHFAAHTRAVELAEQVTAHKSVYLQLRQYADETGRNFRFQAQMDLRMFIQRASSYSQEDIDEAIRWALYRFSEIHPQQLIATITLASSGREIDISSLNYLHVDRVWLDYDESHPGFPPRFVDFEVWPADRLWINHYTEPQAGADIRIWYTSEQTLNGLDDATVTSISNRDLNVVVTGASGYCVQERIQEKETYWGNRDLREWGEQRLREFEAALQRIAHREGTLHSGIARTAALDRYDNTWA